MHVSVAHFIWDSLSSNSMNYFCALQFASGHEWTEPELVHYSPIFDEKTNFRINTTVLMHICSEKLFFELKQVRHWSS